MRCGSRSTSGSRKSRLALNFHYKGVSARLIIINCIQTSEDWTSHTQTTLAGRTTTVELIRQRGNLWISHRWKGYYSRISTWLDFARGSCYLLASSVSTFEHSPYRRQACAHTSSNQQPLPPPQPAPVNKPLNQQTPKAPPQASPSVHAKPPVLRLEEFFMIKKDIDYSELHTGIKIKCKSLWRKAQAVWTRLAPGAFSPKSGGPLTSTPQEWICYSWLHSPYKCNSPSPTTRSLFPSILYSLNQTIYNFISGQWTNMQPQLS